LFGFRDDEGECLREESRKPGGYGFRCGRKQTHRKTYSQREKTFEVEWQTTLVDGHNGKGGRALREVQDLCEE
jgi:hypothetical protein